MFSADEDTRWEAFKQSPLVKHEHIIPAEFIADKWRWKLYTRALKDQGGGQTVAEFTEMHNEGGEHFPFDHLSQHLLVSTRQCWIHLIG